MKKLIEATKNLEDLQEEHQLLGLKEREGKTKIKDTKLKFKEALKKLDMKKKDKNVGGWFNRESTFI
jgi:hypothetical protein